VGAENTFSINLTEFDAMVAELQPRHVRRLVVYPFSTSKLAKGYG
jgi:hypothetical protein